MLKKWVPIISCLMLVVESIISLVQFIIDRKGSLLISLCIFFAVSAFVTMIITLYNEFAGYIKVTNRKKINKKIVEFIETTGETVILSRDLSWVDDVTIGRFRQKVTSSGDNLVIFLPQETETSKKLAEFADVRYYGGIFDGSMERLFSRFTIIHYGTDSVRITYPQENTFWHINTEYAQGDAALTLATDVIKLLDIITKNTPHT